MKLIDLHCDTALDLYHKKLSLADNACHISLKKAEYLDKYIQFAAIFTSSRLTDAEGWEVFLAARENFVAECEKNDVPLIRSKADLEAFLASDKKTAFVLAIEDVRILDSKIERVKEIYDLGVRCVTLLWGGPTTIGGSHDTDQGLTEFGFAALREMLDYGIIPDISHASFSSTHDILTVCEELGKAPIATHMNSYTVRSHSRNLRDDHLERLVKLGGIAGVSFCPPHLTGDEACTSAHVCDHLAYYNDNAKGHAAFGSDYDGTSLPEDIADLTAVPMICEKLAARGLSEAEIEDITWNNALEFLRANLPE